MIDLNVFVPEGGSLQLLTDALNINDQGEIMGLGFPPGVPPVSIDFGAHVFLLVPCRHESESCRDAGTGRIAATSAGGAELVRKRIPRCTRRRVADFCRTIVEPDAVSTWQSQFLNALGDSSSTAIIWELSVGVELDSYIVACHTGGGSTHFTCLCYADLPFGLGPPRLEPCNFRIHPGSRARWTLATTFGQLIVQLTGIAVFVI